MIKTKKVLMIFLLLSLLFTSTAFATDYKHGLSWTTEKTYYEGNTLVIEGYWTNQIDVHISHINWVDMTVYSWNGAFWEIAARGFFNHQKYVNLAPGRSIRSVYQIQNCQIKQPLNRVQIECSYNFNYIAPPNI